MECNEGAAGARPTRGHARRGGVAGLRNVVHAGGWIDHAPAAEAIGGPLFAVRAGDDDGEAAHRRLHALLTALGPCDQLTADVERMAALHEWAVVGDPSGCAVAAIHAGRFAGAVAAAIRDGRDDLRPLLGELDDGLLAGLCLESEAGGADASSPETTATWDPAGGRLLLRTPTPYARKLLPGAPPAGRRSAAVVSARLLAHGRDCGVVPLLVPLADAAGTLAPGVAIQSGDGSCDAAPGTVLAAFEAVSLPFEALLLGPGSSRSLERRGGVLPVSAAEGRTVTVTRLPAPARVCLAASSAAALRAATTAALRPSAPRTAPGALRLAGARSPDRRRRRALIGALADAYAMTALVNAAKHDQQGPVAQRHVHRAEVTAALAATTARTGVERCREHGGAHARRVVERLDGFLRGPLAAEDDEAALAAAAYAMVTGEGYEALAPVPTPVGELDLRDPAWWTWVARTVERHSHARAVVRMRDALRLRPEEVDAWGEVVPDALDVGRRHAVRLTVEALVDDAERLGDGSELQMVLLRMGALWFVGEVDRDAAYLAGHGIVGAETMALLPDLVDHLVDRIEPLTPTLLDAFAIDSGPAARAAPIASAGTAARPAVTTAATPVVRWAG